MHVNFKHGDRVDKERESEREREKEWVTERERTSPFL